MKVLVTGGAGFIGSHLVDSLIKAGDEVVVLDNLSVGRLSNMTQHWGRRGFRFLQGDVCEEGAVAEAMAGSELVFHLAAVVGVKRVVDDPLSALLVNLRGTEVVLAAAKRQGARVILASSSEVYGKGLRFPLTEEEDLLLGPSSVSRWSYAAAKVADEHLALAHAARGLPVVVLRYFNCYGPRLDPNGYASVVGRFIGQALRGEPLTVHGDGQQTRCFTYIADAIRGTLLAAREPAAKGQVINIGTERETTILELAEQVIKATGSSSPITLVPYAEAYGPGFEEPQRRQPGGERARRLLGFEAQVPLEEGLRRTVAAFREEGAGASA